MVSFVAPLLICVSLAGCFVIGLAAVIRMAGPVAGLEHATGVIRLPGEVTATIVALFALATLVFVVHVLRLAWSRRHAEDAEPEEVLEPLRVPAWVRAVRQFLAFLYFVALAYVLSRSGISLDRIMALASGAGAAGGSVPPGPAAEGAPPPALPAHGGANAHGAVRAGQVQPSPPRADRAGPGPGGPGRDQVGDEGDRRRCRRKLSGRRAAAPAARSSPPSSSSRRHLPTSRSRRRGSPSPSIWRARRS